jgi:capsule polysaccharide export protein KpsE/RkpR
MTAVLQQVPITQAAAAVSAELLPTLGQQMLAVQAVLALIIHLGLVQISAMAAAAAAAVQPQAAQVVVLAAVLEEIQQQVQQQEQQIQAVAAAELGLVAQQFQPMAVQV